MVAAKKRGLGSRGMDILLGASKPNNQEGNTADITVETVNIERLQPGVYQPRRQMEETALDELAQSIKEHGLIQPILVRRLDESDKLEIIAGERRWRACQKAGLKQVSVVIHQVDDRTTLAMAIIENIQREDLNPLEIAMGVQRLIEEFKLNHQQVGEILGRSRSAVTNLLRLLRLEEEVQVYLTDGALTMGHARVLLTLESTDQVRFATKIIRQDLSVRETEKLVGDYQQQLANLQFAEQQISLSAALDEEKKVEEAALELAKNYPFRQIGKQLATKLHTQTKIKPGNKNQTKGKVIIEYDSLDELERIAQELLGQSLDIDALYELDAQEVEEH